MKMTNSGELLLMRLHRSNVLLWRIKINDAVGPIIKNIAG